MAAVAEKIAEIIVEVAAVRRAAIEPGASLVADLDIDSLEVVEITIACEEEFGVEISDDETAAVVTFADLVRLVETHLSQIPVRS